MAAFEQTLIQQKGNIPSMDLIDSILKSALESVDPYRLTSHHILLSNNELGNLKFSAGKTQHIFLAAMGKASVAMTQAAVDRLGERITKGVCVCKVLPEEVQNWPNIKLVRGSHPVPDDSSLAAGKMMRKLLQGLTENDLVQVLVSGGSSALVVDPCDGIPLEDIILLNQELLRCGATINEMNCVRKHVERLKGGGLAKLASPARVEALLLSDVIGDDMSVIASGPTVADPSTYEDALAIVSKYDLEGILPRTILDHLEQGRLGRKPETLKPDNEVNRRTRSTIIGSNRHAIEAAMHEAERLGITAHCVSRSLTGEAEGAAQWFMEKSIVSMQSSDQPCMMIAGGETTVTVKGNGRGGRNLHLALATVKKMAGFKDAVLMTLATDGEDGPTDAAGAIVTGETKENARALGLDPDDFLQRNDSYTFFEKVGGLIKIGSTGTNVNDLMFFFQF